VERILADLRRQMTNVVLIGMPGSGKTTVGRLLSALSGREAVDLDEEIVRRTGRSIPDLFAAEGEAAFRALEREEAARWGRESGKILITGGGVVKDPRNRAALRQNGRIYELRRDLKRLSTAGRPLSQGADLQALYAQRAPLYAAFRDASADNNGPAEDTAAAIWRDFCAHLDS
jgi:shikimate dehydrogenase